MSLSRSFLKPTLAIAAAFAALTFATAAHANEIANPDFVGGTDDGKGVGYGQIPGWTAAGTNTYDPYMSGSAKYTPFDSAGTAGQSNAGFIQVYTPDGPNTNSLTSTTAVSMVAGDSYVLDFADAYRAGYAAPTISIMVDGVVVGTVTPTTDTSMTYYKNIFTWTGATGAYDFEILVTGNGSDSTAVVTNMLLTGAAPEPSSLLLLGTGLLAIGFMMRRRLAL